MRIILSDGGVLTGSHIDIDYNIIVVDDVYRLSFDEVESIEEE